MKYLITLSLLITVYCISVLWVADDYKQKADDYFRYERILILNWDYSSWFDLDTTLRKEIIKRQRNDLDSCDNGYNLYLTKYKQTLLLLPEFLR